MSSSSSSSSDGGDPSGAAAEEIEREDAEAGAVETVSGADDFAADISSIDVSAASSTSFGEENVEAGVDTEDDEVSMDELEAAEASSESTLIASASKPISAEGAVEEHVTVGVVISVDRVVETTPITITSSGGTVQGDPSGTGSCVDPSLLDSSPSTRQYVRRTRRGSIVSTDSKRAVLATVRVPTPPSPLPKSGGTAPTPTITVTAVSAAVVVQESETAPAIVGGVPGNKEVSAHIPDVPEGNNIVDSMIISENLMIGTDSGVGMTQIGHAEVAASEEPIQADARLGSDMPAMEEAFVQDPADDISMEDMADTHDSYDAVLAGEEDPVAATQAADVEITAPITAHTSPTKTGNWLFINILPLLLLDGRDFLKYIGKT